LWHPIHKAKFLDNSRPRDAELASPLGPTALHLIRHHAREATPVDHRPGRQAHDFLSVPLQLSLVPQADVAELLVLGAERNTIARRNLVDGVDLAPVDQRLQLSTVGNRLELKVSHIFRVLGERHGLYPVALLVFVGKFKVHVFV